MSRSVTFNGITRTIPGGISKIRTDNVASVGNSASTVGLIGESDAGAPGSVSGLVSLSDPSKAVELFGSGPLVDAILLAFQSSADDLVPGGAGEVLVYKTNASTQSDIHIPNDTGAAVSDTAAASSTTTVVKLTTGGLTVDAYADHIVDIQLVALTGSPTFRRTIVSNTATELTITPALPSAPAATNPVSIRNTAFVVTSRDYGLDTASVTVDYTYTDPTATSSGGFQATVELNGDSQLSPTLGEKQRMVLLYRGGTNTVAQDTVTSVASSLTNTNIPLTTGGLTASAQASKTVVISVSGLTEQVKISTNGTGSLTLVSPGISNEMVAALKAAGDGEGTVDIKTVSAATVSITGANGVATGLTTSITGVSGDNLSITFSANQTIRQLADQINKNPNYLATIPNNVNGNLALCADLDYGYDATDIQIQSDRRATYGSEYSDVRAFTADIFDIVNWFNDVCEEATAERYTSDSAGGNYLTLSDFASGAVSLSGGTRGVSSNSNFQAGLDALLERKVDYVVPLIDRDLADEGYSSTATWASVAAQLKSHVFEARGASGVERGGFLGFRGTKDEYIAACNSMNDEDIQVVSQYPTVLDSTGTLTEKGPREFAVMAASMRSGVGEVGEPLTNKYIRCTSLTQDSSWTPADKTDAVDLINNGALFAVEKPGVGFRWVRDLTSWIKDDHIAYAEGSVRDIVRKVVYTLRSEIEDKFTGRKAKPINITAIRDFAVSIFEQMREDEWIVDSTDPVTGEVTRAYFNLKVTSEGDVTRLSAGFYPVPGINFQLNDLLVRVPTQAA